MSGIVHDQCSLLHLLLDESRDVRIAVACRRADTVVSIPHDSFHQEVRVAVLHQSCHGVCIGHVDIVVAVVTHHTEQVLPRASLLVVDIVVDLVNYDSCIIVIACCDASYGDV